MNYPPTPMLDKETEAFLKGHSQELGQFLDWLHDAKNIQFARYDKMSDACRNCGHEEVHNLMAWRCTFADDEGEECGCNNNDRGNPNHMLHISETTGQLLADYFEIDLVRIEKERRAVLEFIRKKQY